MKQSRRYDDDRRELGKSVRKTQRRVDRKRSKIALEELKYTDKRSQIHGEEIEDLIYDDYRDSEW
jgi:hypothetical protein